MKEMIRVENLSKVYGKKVVVQGLNFSIYEGDIFGFLGPNGAGKSTSIKMILNLIKKTDGKIFIEGYDIDKEFKKAIKDVSAIVEAPSMYLNLTAYDNLKIMKNFNKQEGMDIEEVLKIVGLLGREKEKAINYSLGMKQRLAIGMALIKNPKIIILDEPTNGLDPHGIVEIRELIKTLSRKYKKTILISSHILYEIEMMCNRVVIINKGTVLRQGSINEIKNRDNKFEVVTKEKEKAINLIKNIDYVKKAYFSIEGIMVEIDRNKTSNLIKQLVFNDIEIDLVENRSITLEDAYMDIIGGNIKND